MVKFENKKEKVIVSKLSELNENLEKEDVKIKFHDIAKYLLENRYIKQGNIEYRFLEVEFYYYSKLHQDIKENTGQPFVYPRQCSKAGTFFIHSSGLDICFRSKITDEDKFLYGGGILLRSLLRIDPQDKSMMVVTGPWDCCDALFNYTDENNHPIIEETKESIEVDFVPVRRYISGEYNIKMNIKMKDEEYCFYNNNYHKSEFHWTDTDGNILKRYNPVTGKTKSEYGNKPWNRPKDDGSGQSDK